MRLNVNGRPLEMTGDDVLTSLVATVVPDPRGVAVAVNGHVVRSAEWVTTVLSEGDVVEVVTAHQGG